MYAQIALNVPASTAFTYAIPPELHGVLVAGHLVQVPFRTATEYGVILRIDETAPSYQTKPILLLVDPQPVLSEREIALARWLSEATLAPIGFCLWLWLPVGLTSHSDFRYSLIDGSDARTQLEREIVALLKRRGALRGRQLDFSFSGEPWRSEIEGMVKAGMVAKESVLAAPRVKPRIIETAALAIHPRLIDEAVEALARPSRAADLLEWLACDPKARVPLRDALRASSATKANVTSLETRGAVGVDEHGQIALTMWPEDVPALLADLRKTEKPLRILRVLARQSAPIDVSWLFAQSGADMAELRRLEEAELVLLGEKRQYRDSLADTHFIPSSAPPLTAQQADALNAIIGALDDPEAPRRFLLHGVTGSGKTEIYLRAIEKALDQGKSVLFLVPEISLTPQTVRRVAGRFPGQVAVVHSGLSETERYDTWRRAREDLVQIVVGPRSAMFTPLQNPGLVIVDEAHDHSYKHSPPMTPPYYDARRLAEAYSQVDNSILVFGSATPDVEMMHRVDTDELTLLTLPDRIMGHRERIADQARTQKVVPRYTRADADALTIDLPEVEVADMREELKSGNTHIFSRRLQHLLGDTLSRGEQAILFLNRRGQATYVFCRDCGYVVRCPKCETPLTYHRHGQLLRCHRCGHTEPEPRICPQCHSRRIKFFGAGTQQVEQAVIEAFPKARILRWDADTAATQAAHDAILQRFVHGQADVLIGTQMIAKGLDLPMVTLVGIVSADVGLNLPDFRAGERTFQVLTQVAGRAGRGLLGGRVVLQTYQPEHYAVQAAARHDYATFYRREIAYRRELAYPPFARMARILFRFPNEAKAMTEAERAANLLSKRIIEQRLPLELIGPAPCFFTREDDHVRWHLIVRGADPVAALRGLNVPSGWHVDVDPVEVL